ncbi:MAG: type II toxin-antitoxin system HicB family antitoxin [Gammaproteobacteria bacterium]
MHLYIGVRLKQQKSGNWGADAPDVPGCEVRGDTSGEALARVRLALEGRIAERLGRGESLPEPRGLDELQAAENSGGEFFSVHMNLRHLQALARHQAGRWEKPEQN